MTSKTSDHRVMLELLAKENSRDILCFTSKKEYSANQLSNELDIAPATIYRNLKHLEDEGMIQIVKIIMDYHGNEEKYYRCSVRRIIIDISNGKLDIRSEKEDLDDRITRLWKRIVRS
jgi:predicted transcriptional regulator